MLATVFTFSQTVEGWTNKLIEIAGGRLDSIVDGAGGSAMNDYLKVC